MYLRLLQRHFPDHTVFDVLHEDILRFEERPGFRKDICEYYDLLRYYIGEAVSDTTGRRIIYDYYTHDTDIEDCAKRCGVDAGAVLKYLRELDDWTCDTTTGGTKRKVKINRGLHFDT